jgi:hypothetical protein
VYFAWGMVVVGEGLEKIWVRVVREAVEVSLEWEVREIWGSQEGVVFAAPYMEVSCTRW